MIRVYLLDDHEVVRRGIRDLLEQDGDIEIVGESGSGKTTLVKLLCRLYDPTGGAITIDGVDLRHFETTALRREIARCQRYRAKHPYAGQLGLIYLRCVYMGKWLGGRARKARRCTKRLGSRLCWNWRVWGTDRCYRHRRE